MQILQKRIQNNTITTPIFYQN